MTKQERIDVIRDLFEAGQTREEVKEYLITEAKWELKESTLDKYLAEAAEGLEPVEDESPEAELEAQEPVAPENSEEDTKEESKPEQEGPTDEELTEKAKEALEKGVEPDEVQDDLAKMLEDQARAQRILYRAHGQIEQAKQDELAKEQLKEREAFDKKVNSHLGPAQNHLKNALDEIAQIKKIKGKAGKATTRFRVAEKIIIRLLKTQLSRP